MTDKMGTIGKSEERKNLVDFLVLEYLSARNLYLGTNLCSGYIGRVLCIERNSETYQMV